MLEFIGIHKAFGSKTVADNINLNVADGELLAILGASGCGKSTLLNIAAGLVMPDSGEVRLHGTPLNPLPPEKRRIALMFQDFALLPHLNAWQNVAFPLKLQGIANSEARRRALAMLAEVGLANEQERPTQALSGGEQQRVALARALVAEPRLLLLDEAFSSLDTHLRQSLCQQTLAHIRRLNIPAILVTHDPEEAFQLADHIALMHQGRIIQHGSPAALLARPASRQAAHLLGCLNVRDDHYIPPSALLPGQGQAAEIQEVIRLADTCRLRLNHPQHGSLLLNLDWPHAMQLGSALQSGQTIPLAVDSAQIVWFS